MVVIIVFVAKFKLSGSQDPSLPSETKAVLSLICYAVAAFWTVFPKQSQAQ